jgi:hypothetical protein
MLGCQVDKNQLSFVADRPPPPYIDYQELLMAAETLAEYFFDSLFDREERRGRFRAALGFSSSFRYFCSP